MSKTQYSVLDNLCSLALNLADLIPMKRPRLEKRIEIYRARALLAEIAGESSVHWSALAERYASELKEVA